MFPDLKANLMDNMKTLKNTMTDMDWKVSAHCQPTLSLPGAPLLWGGTGVTPPGKAKSCLSQACVTPTPREVVLLTTFPGPGWSSEHGSPMVFPLSPLTCWFPSLQAFESWMHKWLLFEMAKNPKPEDPKMIPAEKGIRDGGC